MNLFSGSKTMQNILIADIFFHKYFMMISEFFLKNAYMIYVNIKAWQGKTNPPNPACVLYYSPIQVKVQTQ